MYSPTSELVEQLERLRDRAVPVIGAGLASGCGAPSSPALAAGLASAAQVAYPDGTGLFVVANDLEERFGAEWVQEQTAAITLAAQLVPTPMMLAVTLVARRLVVTTNYDDAIEAAAQRHGLVPISLTPDDVPVLLHGPERGQLHVLHLHGTAHRPASIVLTDSTYLAARDDEALQQAVRTVAAGNTLVFIGHRLDENETHLRRDISRTVELFGSGDHLLLHASGSMLDPEAFQRATGVRPEAYPNPDGEHRALVSIARRLGAPPLEALGATVEALTVPIEPAYEPMPLAPASEVSTDEQQGVWLYGQYFGRQPVHLEHVTSSRILLLGQPGAGKTQALLHLVLHAPNSIYVRLGNVSPPTQGQDPRDLLVRWVQQAGSAVGDVPAVTRSSLDEQAYSFLLDSLDEHVSDRREDVIGAVEEMAAQLPQHRWIVASRRVPELGPDKLTAFSAYQLVPSRDWLLRYAEQHGVTADEIDVLVRDTSGLSDIVEIAQFAAATVSWIREGRAVPTTPLDLLLTYASRGLENEETRLGASSADVDDWLDRLALAMLCAGIDTADPADVVSVLLRGRLPDELTGDWLVARVLLVEAAGRLRFPTRPLRDARAARALLRHPTGRELLLRFGVVEIAGERHLRPEWQYVADLLVGEDFAWGVVVESVDPLTVARGVASREDSGSALNAVRVIIDWYRTHRIHIPRTREGQLRDDLEALDQLAALTSVTSEAVGLERDLRDPDPATRANAVTIVSTFGENQLLEPRIRRLLDDADPVVRRRTAEAIVELGLAHHADALAERAVRDRDDLARRGLASAALRVADATAMPGLLRRLPERLRREVQLTIDHRMTRQEQMTFLATAATLDREWLRHLAKEGPGSWTPHETMQLSQLWHTTERYYLDPDVAAVLQQHPLDALKGAFATTIEPGALFDLLPLLERADLDQLDVIARAHGQEAETLVRQFRDWQQRSIASPIPATTIPAFDLDNAVRSGDLDGIIANRPSADALKALAPAQSEQLGHLLDDVWWDPTTSSSPILRIVRTERGRWTANVRDFELARLGLQLGRDLSEDEWFKAVELAVHDPDEERTIRDAFQPAWMARVLNDLPSMDDDLVTSTVRCLPGPWSDALAETVADRVFGSGDQGLHELAADRLGDEGFVDLLAERARRCPSLAIDRVLCENGDADAELRLIADFEARSHPKLDHWGGDAAWIVHVRHRSSSAAVEFAVRAMLQRGDESHELTPLFRALERCAGDDVLTVYDVLIADPLIPAAPFLWYRKQEYVAAAGVATNLAEVMAELYRS